MEVVKVRDSGMTLGCGSPLNVSSKLKPKISVDVVKVKDAGMILGCGSPLMYIIVLGTLSVKQNQECRDDQRLVVFA